jgi:hypothetical protein
MSNKNKYQRPEREGRYEDDWESDEKTGRNLRNQLQQIARGKVALEDLDDLELGQRR